MKNIKKVSALSLAALSMIALSACGGVKSYKNEVDAEEFGTKFMAAMIGLDYDRDYVAEMKVKSTETEKSDYEKNVSKSEYSYKQSYDKDNEILTSKGTGKSTSTTLDSKYTRNYKENSIIQKEGEDFYYLDNISKTFEKTSSVTSSDSEIMEQLMEAMDNISSTDDDDKLYYDEKGDSKIFTVVLTKKDYEGEQVVQFVISDDSLCLYMTSNYTRTTEENGEKYEYKEDNEASYEIKFKDVKLSTKSRDGYYDLDKE